MGGGANKTTCQAAQKTQDYPAIYFIGYFLDIYPKQLSLYFKQILKQRCNCCYYLNNTDVLHAV